jgi:hypothetical protein
MKNEKTIYVLLPVKATIYDGKVVATEPPTISQVAQACDRVGFWESSLAAETAIKHGMSASPPDIDKILKG